MNQPVAVHKFQDAQDFATVESLGFHSSVDQRVPHSRDVRGRILVPSKIRFLQSANNCGIWS